VVGIPELDTNPIHTTPHPNTIGSLLLFMYDISIHLFSVIHSKVPPKADEVVIQ
jgi:hypothetical protein